MRTKFYGIYAPHIEQLITLKRLLGFKYATEEYFFGLFDKFTVSREEKSVGITKELAEAWCKPDPNESTSSRLKKIACINQLTSFLTKQGIHSYVMRGLSYTYSFCPYIFSRQEMEAIFSACDNLKLCSGLKSVIFSIPALVRLLYGTGLRIGEALALKNADVNLNENYLIVRDSKNGQERMIPISHSLSEVCSEYVANRNKIPVAKSDRFFISLAGKKCEIEDVRRWFTKVLAEANIRRSATGPRLHDLRHTFCVHSLAMMAEAGADLYCSLPILSRYIGHLSLQSTNAYVRLTAEMYPGLLKEVEMVCFNVFPKLSPYETN
jgi:site-specific recombinase XerD